MTLLPTTRRGTGSLRRRAAVLVAAAAALSLPVAAESLDERGFVGLVDGYAVVERGDVLELAAEGLALLAGDHLTTRDGRVELVLAGEVAVYVGADSELTIAPPSTASAGDDIAHLLLLDQGELLLAGEGSSPIATRVDTDNATLYVDGGAFRVERFEESTRVVGRRGEAELRTRHGMVTVAAGEEARVDGDALPVVARAGDEDALERWVAALAERGERWASCGGRPCGRRFVVEPESTVCHSCDFTIEGFDDWAGGTVHEPGRARRTRPPHPPDEPGEETDGDGRVAVPIDPEPEVVDDDPGAGDEPDEPFSPIGRANAREIVAGIRNPSESTSESFHEPPSLPDAGNVAGATAEVARTAEPVEPQASVPAAEAASETADARPETIEVPATTVDVPVADTAAPSSDMTIPDTPPPPDAGSSDVAPIEPPAVADAGGEPNRG